MSQDLEAVIDQISDKLPDFLSLHGRTENAQGKFRCPTGTHEDKHPSCSYVPGNRQVWHCHQCGASGSIFHAAEYLEALPSRGPEFRTVTLKSLSERFGIEFDPYESEDKEQALKRQRLWHTMSDAANLVTKIGTYGKCQERGWSESTCKNLGIATVDFDILTKEMNDLGWSDSDLEEADISDRLFNTRGITFTIKDQWGRPIGFAIRNPDGTEGKKYVNTSSRVPIFGKNSNLYNLYNIRRRFRDVYVVEGYACVATAYEKGIENLVAVCGATVSDEQIQMLVDSHVTKAVLGLDADSAGRTATIRALEEVFGGREDIRVEILDTTKIAESDLQPKTGPARKAGHCDVDELLRINEEALSKKNRKDLIKDPFEWMLTMLEEEDPEDIAKRMIPVIINEPSNVRRDKLASILAKHTGIRKVSIERDLDAAINKQSHEMQQKVDNIAKACINRLKKATAGTIDDILEDTRTRVEQIESSIKRPDRFNVTETLAFLDETKRMFEDANGDLRGLDSGFHGLNRATLGIPKHGRVIGIPAQPNVGKTGLVTAIGWKTLLNNKDKDHIVLHWSIDDSRDVVISRIIAMEAQVPIDLVTQPMKITDPGMRKRLEKAWYMVKAAIEKGRYDIRDASQGTTLDYLRDWLQFVHKENPESSILVIFDNFHKLEGPENDERIKFKNASQAIHRMKNDPRCGRPTFLATMEMNKTRDRQASVFDIAETNQILYDSDLVLILHSEFIDSGENALNYWEFTDIETGEIIKQPMVKVIVEKNKISGWKGSFWLKFLAAQSTFTEVPHYKERKTEDEE